MQSHPAELRLEIGVENKVGSHRPEDPGKRFSAINFIAKKGRS